MSYTPPWNNEEFETLLQNHHLLNDQFGELLSRRTVGAINWVRSGIHSFHQGGNTTMLSKMMIHRLEYGNGQIRCPRCSARI